MVLYDRHIEALVCSSFLSTDRLRHERQAFISSVAVLAVGLIFAGCTPQAASTSVEPSASPPPAASPSQGGETTESPSPTVEWVLESGTFRGSPLPLLPDHPITLVVTERELTGVAPCNQYWADIERSGDDIVVRESRASAMGCGDPLDATEEAFLAALPEVTHIDESRPDELVLEGPEVELRFKPSR